MMRRQVDLILVVTCALGLTTVILAFPLAQPARIILGLPFVLILPGYALLAALFPRKDDLGGAERAGLSLGLSIAVVPLIAIALDYSPWGAHLHSTVASLSLFIVLAAAAAAVRRRMLPTGQAFGVTVDLPPSQWSRARPVDRLLALGVALSLISLAVAAFFVATSRHSSRRLTEFYVLGPSGKAEGYPDLISLRDSATVIVGVVNHEGADATFQMAVEMNGDATDRIGSPVLADGEKWERKVSIVPTVAGEDQEVDFVLHRNGAPEIYRSLYLLLDVDAEVEAPTAPSPTPVPQAEPAVLPEAAPPSDEDASPPEPTPPPPETPAVHIVLAGENLTFIARDYGITLAALLAANDIDDPNLIYPDQYVTLPLR
jgi:uncharacterized membrane protein